MPNYLKLFMPSGKKGHKSLNKSADFRCRFFLSMYDLLFHPARKG